MLDLSSIQEKHNEKYLTLEHLRAFIYKSKLDINKTKGKNEKSFYGVTCAKDALFLLQEALDKGVSISCYKMNTNIGIPEKVNYSEVKNYLTYLIIIDEDNTTIPYIDALNYYEDNKYNYLNIDFLFIREEIEKIIGAKIPYIENLSDVENADLIPLQKEKAESVSELNQEIERLKSELEEKDKKITELQTALDKMDYPIHLNKFMENDRLALAIQARKDYWANYAPNLNNAPKAEPTAREIKEKYGLSQKQAEAIEIIACPINRN